MNNAEIIRIVGEANSLKIAAALMGISRAKLYNLRKEKGILLNTSKIIYNKAQLKNIPLKETAKAYFAGLFDGEGCIAIHYKRKKPSELGVTLTNNHIGVLQFVKNNFGGRISNLNGGIATPDWRCEGWKAYAFLKIVFPYLVVKQSQAKLALEFQDTTNKGIKITQEILERRFLIDKQIKEERLKIRERLV